MGLSIKGLPAPTGVVLSNKAVLTWVTTSLGNIILNDHVSIPLSATIVPSSRPIVYFVSNGLLPVGLTLNGATGVISGTPIETENYSVDITAQDGTDPFGGMSVQTFSGVVIADNITFTSGGTLNASQGAPVTFTTNAISLSGNPIAYSISSGTLPAGLTLNTDTGVITGTPTGTGSYNFSISAYDGISTATDQFTGTITPDVISFTSNAQLTGTANSAIIPITVSAVSSNNNNATFSYSVTSGALPVGLSLDPVTGIISGTPSTSGSFNFTITANDGFSTGTLVFTGTINGGTQTFTGELLGYIPILPAPNNNLYENWTFRSATGSSWATASRPVLKVYETGNTSGFVLSLCSNILYGMGMYVGVDRNYTVFSTDGATWYYSQNSYQNGSGSYNGSVFTGCYNGSQFAFISGSKVLTSTDGINWTVSTSNISNIRNFVSNGSIYVASITAGTCYTSTDAVNWTLQTTPLTGVVSFGTVYYDGVNFMSFNATASHSYAVTSPDGVNWTLATDYWTDISSHISNSTLYHYLPVTVCGNGSVVVGIFNTFKSGGSSTYYGLYSNDHGQTWNYFAATTPFSSALTVPEIVWNGTEFHANTCSWVNSPNGPSTPSYVNKVMTSTDGQTWAAGTNLPAYGTSSNLQSDSPETLAANMTVGWNFFD